MKITFIVAANKDVATLFARKIGLTFSQWRYGTPTFMEGIGNNCEVILVDGWQKHPKADRIEEIVRLAKYVGVTTKTGSI